MAFASDREDINSVCMTGAHIRHLMQPLRALVVGEPLNWVPGAAVQSLMEKYDIAYDQVGRLEVRAAAQRPQPAPCAAGLTADVCLLA